MNVWMRVRTPTRSSFLLRHYTKFHPRTPLRQDTIHVGRFVAGTLLAFGTLGFGLHALRNAAFDEFRPLTLGLVDDNTHSSDQRSGRHVHHQNKAVDPSLEFQVVFSPSDSPISLASSYGSQDDVENAIEELRRALPGQHRVQTSKDSLQLYGSSENSYHPTSPHSVIVQVKSTEDVVKVVDISRKYRVPLVPYSGATSLEGHFSGVSTRYFSVSWCLDEMLSSIPQGVYASTCLPWTKFWK